MQKRSRMAKGWIVEAESFIGAQKKIQKSHFRPKPPGLAFAPTNTSKLQQSRSAIEPKPKAPKKKPIRARKDRKLH